MATRQKRILQFSLGSLLWITLAVSMYFLGRSHEKPGKVKETQVEDAQQSRVAIPLGHRVVSLTGTGPRRLKPGDRVDIFDGTSTPLLRNVSVFAITEESNAPAQTSVIVTVPQSQKLVNRDGPVTFKHSVAR